MAASLTDFRAQNEPLVSNIYYYLLGMVTGIVEIDFARILCITFWLNLKIYLK